MNELVRHPYRLPLMKFSAKFSAPIKANISTKCFKRHNNYSLYSSTACNNINRNHSYYSSPHSIHQHQRFTSLHKNQSQHQNHNAYNTHYTASKIIAEHQPPILRYMAASLVNLKHIQTLQQQNQHYQQTKPVWCRNKFIRTLHYQHRQNHANYQANFHKLKQAAIQNYILSLNSHVMLKNAGVNQVNLAHTVKQGWHKAGKYSYLRGRCLTGSVHLASNAMYIIYCALKAAAKNAAATSAGIEMSALLSASEGLNISYLVGQCVYKIMGESYMGYKRAYAKCHEEIYACNGFPKINSNLAQADNISIGLNKIKAIRKNLPNILHEIKIIEHQINCMKSSSHNLSDIEAKQINILKQKHAYLLKKIQLYIKDIQNFEAARAREKIEYKGNESTLKINTLVTALNFILSLIASTSIIYAPVFSLPIKIGAGAVSFVATFAQYFINSLFSGKNLCKKYDECIYQNLKNTLMFDLQDVAMQKIEKMHMSYQQKIIAVHKSDVNKKNKNKQIECINLAYEKALQTKFTSKNIKNLSQGWQKPMTFRCNNAIQWLNTQINIKLYKLCKLRNQQIKQKNKKNTESIQDLITDIRELMQDQHTMHIILKQAKKFGKINNPSKNDKKLYRDKIAKELNNMHSTYILDSFNDENCALQLMKDIKKQQVNDAFKDFSSYSAPAMLTSILSAATVGGICGADVNSDNFDVNKSGIPLSGVLSLLNHSQALANSSNRAEGEYIKKYTKQLIHKHNEDNTHQLTYTNFVNDDPNASSSISSADNNMHTCIDNFLYQIQYNDAFVKKIIKSKNLVLQNEVENNDENITIPIDRDKSYAKKQKFSSQKSKWRIYIEMMFGGIKHAINYYINAKYQHKKIQPIYEMLSTYKMQ